MTIYKTADFSRNCEKARILNEDLIEAVHRAEAELIDGQLGKFLIKQRIARPDQGRSRGFRGIIVFKLGSRALFVHLFPKSSKANLTPRELESFRAAAKVLAELNDMEVAALVAAGDWIEVKHDDDG